MWLWEHLPLSCWVQHALEFALSSHSISTAARQALHLNHSLLGHGYCAELQRSERPSSESPDGHLWWNRIPAESLEHNIAVSVRTNNELAACLNLEQDILIGARLPSSDVHFWQSERKARLKNCLFFSFFFFDWPDSFNNGPFKSGWCSRKNRHQSREWKRRTFPLNINYRTNIPSLKANPSRS